MAGTQAAILNHELRALIVENKVDTAWDFDHPGFFSIFPRLGPKFL